MKNCEDCDHFESDEMNCRGEEKICHEFSDRVGKPLTLSQRRKQRRIAEQEDVVNILEYQLAVARKKLEDMKGNSHDNEE